MILIGTSGYSFPDWVGAFYPPGTESRQMLDYYVREFSTVEVNSTYYRVPPPSTLRGMERRTPPHFEFVVKTHHDMTHEQSLDPELYRSFARAVEPLEEAEKLSGILAQFPQAFHRTPENERFLDELKRRLPPTPLFIEFRHDSWVRNGAFLRLEEHGLHFVSVDEPDLPRLLPPIARATGEIGYVRFHGRNKRNWWKRESEPVAGRDSDLAETTGSAESHSTGMASLGPLFAGAPDETGPRPRPVAPPKGRSKSLLRYDYLYSEEELKEWVGKIRELATSTKKTFVFFNNCHAGQAATGAKLMRRLLEGEGLL
jgi:uncharacterized protein YecE (DUF72 family)